MKKIYNCNPRLNMSEVHKIVTDPKVIRVNNFNEKDLENFENDLNLAHQTGQPVIPIEIDSYGGNAYGVLGFIAAIEACKLPVATIVTTKAMSAGAILFMCGTEGYRYIHPNATLMIHDLATFMCGKIEEIKVSTQQCDYLNNDIYKRMALKIGKDKDYLLDLIKKHNHVDWYLTPKEAKKHNIANHIKIPSMNININIDYVFE